MVIGRTPDADLQNLATGEWVTVSVGEVIHNEYGIPTRVFEGWWFYDYILLNYGDISSPRIGFEMINKDVELFAMWRTIFPVHQLTFNLNGGTPTIDPIYIPRDNYIFSFLRDNHDTFFSTTPTKDNHIFMDWYMDADFTIPFTRETLMPDHGATLYARWQSYDPATLRTVTLRFVMPDGYLAEEQVFGGLDEDGVREWRIYEGVTIGVNQFDLLPDFTFTGRTSNPANLAYVNSVLNPIDEWIGSAPVIMPLMNISAQFAFVMPDEDVFIYFYFDEFRLSDVNITDSPALSALEVIIGRTPATNLQNLIPGNNITVSVGNVVHYEHGFPTRHFAGWYLDGATFTAPTITFVMPNRDVNLVAIWYV
jgi:uncharacterized repeat protein (TIGR02543 family)